MNAMNLRRGTMSRRDALVALGGMTLSLATGRAAATGRDDPIKIGMIGLDTSHVAAFAAVLNGAKMGDEAHGARVVAGYPGGSSDLPASASRVQQHTNELKDKYGVEIVQDIAALLTKVDAVMIESVDGRPHLEQAKPVFAARKRCFIDKPFTASLKDAKDIFELSKKHSTPFFSCSCYRFAPEILALRNDKEVGKMIECESTYTMSIEPHHPDLFWYGIHGVEALYTVMGPGCEWVERTPGPELDVTKGGWKDGRIGVFRGVRKGKYENEVVLRGEKGEKRSEKPKGSIYYPLIVAVVKFFQTGKAPIDPEETLEIIKFMTAAQLSKERGAARVNLAELK